MDNKNQNSLLTERQASELLQVSARTMQSWRVSGRGPKFIRISARAIRYRFSDLVTWTQNLVVSSTSDQGGER